MIICERCGNYFARKDSLTRHRNRINACHLTNQEGNKDDMDSESDKMYGGEIADNYLKVENDKQCERSTQGYDENSGSVGYDGQESEDDIANYAWHDSESAKKNHSILLPSNIRAIIVGKSGSGKTTLLNSLLLKPDMIDYEKLMVCGRSLHQPEYRILQLGFDKGLSKNQIRKLFQKQEYVMEDGGPDKVLSGVTKFKGGIEASFFDDVTMIPDPSEHDPLQRNLLILDDVMLSPQNKVEAYFTRGRHNSVDVIYITQSYFRLPRQTIRENGNIFMFFLQDRKNLVHIFNDHCAGDGISLDTFCRFCNEVWRECKHNYVTIDLSRTVDSGKYRKNLNDFWIPERV